MVFDYKILYDDDKERLKRFVGYELEIMAASSRAKVSYDYKDGLYYAFITEYA